MNEEECSKLATDLLFRINILLHENLGEDGGHMVEGILGSLLIANVLNRVEKGDRKNLLKHLFVVILEMMESYDEGGKNE
jgi:hypothetical protein